MLSENDLARMEHRARRAGQPGWTGTSGTLAADVMRLLEERRRLLAELASCRGAPVEAADPANPAPSGS